MLTSRVAEPHAITWVLSGKAPITKASFIQVLSSSSEEHVDLSGDELDFDNEPAPPDTGKFTHIFEEEMQVDVPVMVPPLGEVVTTKGSSSIFLNYYSIDLDKRCFKASFEGHLQELLPVLKL